MLSATSASNNARARRGVSSTQGARDLDVAHAELPPVARQPIGAGERTWQTRDPGIKEGLQLARAESITDGLQAGGIRAACKAVGQLGEDQPLGSRLTLGPRVAIDPHLQGVGEVAADRDEAKTERRVQDVEVGDRHSTIGLVKAELSAGFGRSLVAQEDLLDLLGHDDGDHPRFRGLVDDLADVIDLAVIPSRTIRRVQMEHGNAVAVGEGADRVAEAIANLLEQCGRGDGVAQVLGQEGDHLAAHLQLWDVAIEVHAVKALEIQHDVTVEHIVDVDRLSHPATSCHDEQAALHRKRRHRTHAGHLGGLRRASLIV
jgi:hypothetical protein